jgi:prevent-host-death family protein
MEILNASDAKREFGEMLLKVQQAPIGINKNGKPVAVIVSVNEYEELHAIKKAQLKSLLQEGLNDLNAGKINPSKTVLDRLRKTLN